jgi:Zn-dependent protease with chaperone function
MAGLAAWAGAVAATYPFDREVFPWLTTRAWCHQVFAAWTIRFATWFLFLGIAALMPAELDWRCGALSGVFVAALAIWIWGGLVWSCRKLGVLTTAPERLRKIVASISGQMQVPFRRVWLLKSSSASAFALPYTGDLLVSERLLELHPDDEVTAICAHELGHLSESRLMLAVRLAGLLFYLPLLFIKPAAVMWGPGGVLTLLGLSWLVNIGSRRFSRRLERRADSIATANQSDAGTYARALGRLHEDNLVPAVMPRQRTHPDLYDRLLAAGVQPDYPRPPKPSAAAPHAIALSMLLGVLIVTNLQQTPDEPETHPFPAIAESSIPPPMNGALAWSGLARKSKFLSIKKWAAPGHDTQDFGVVGPADDAAVFRHLALGH